MLASSHADVSHLIKSVLYYLKGMERLATMANDRTARQHFEECWTTVWRAYYGGYSLPTVPVFLSVPAQTDRVPASKPAWFVTKYGRPTRKVIGRTAEKIDMGKRRPPLLVSYDLLECGHKVQGNETHGASTPARHRRCAQCVPAERKVAGSHHGSQSNTRAVNEMAECVRRMATRH